MKSPSKLLLLPLVAMVALSACTPATQVAPTATPEPAAPQADLSGIKTYLVDKGTQLKAGGDVLKASSDAYYELAKAANFDYVALWADKPTEVSAALVAAKAAWTTSSPTYEQMEGIVAGTPSLAEFDVILDAGASGADDPEGAVPFDLTLPDGAVLPKPGNLFGVLESTLWGTYPEFTTGIEADLDADGTVEFGETLPDANVLKGASDAFAGYTTDLFEAAQAWTPSESDAFTSLVVMVPTMSEYFSSWKNSRFILGDTSTQRDFVVISRLNDITNILGSLQVVYTGVKPLVEADDAAQAAQIEQGITDLKAFVADVYTKEQGGQQFTPEEADILGAEAQDRATAIAGQVAQVAAKLGITIAE